MSHRCYVDSFQSTPFTDDVVTHCDLCTGFSFQSRFVLCELLAKNNISRQFKTNIRSFVSMMSFSSTSLLSHATHFNFAQHICSDRCQCPFDYTHSMRYMHFLHLCRWFEGCSLDGLYTVRAFIARLLLFYTGFDALIEKYRPLILGS